MRFVGRLIWPERAFMRQRYPGDGPVRLTVRYVERWLGVLREHAGVRRRARG